MVSWLWVATITSLFDLFENVFEVVEVVVSCGVEAISDRTLVAVLLCEPGLFGNVSFFDLNF